MTDNIEWGPWFVSNGKPPYQYNNDPVEYHSFDSGGTWPTNGKAWQRGEFYRVSANHPHYTPEGQLYYLKQQFPDVAWVQALEAPETNEKALLKARELYKQVKNDFGLNEPIDLGTFDNTFGMEYLIKGIKAGMEMKK